MDTDVAQAQVMLQLRQMNISQEQPPASLPATASSESVASLASVSSMSEADSGMGSDSDKVGFRFLYFDFNHIKKQDEFMESDHEDTESSKGVQQEQQKQTLSQPCADQINGFPHLLKRAHLIPMDSHNLI